MPLKGRNIPWHRTSANITVRKSARIFFFYYSFFCISKLFQRRQLNKMFWGICLPWLIKKIAALEKMNLWQNPLPLGFGLHIWTRRIKLFDKMFFLDNANSIKVIPEGWESNQFNFVLEKLNCEDWSIFLKKHSVVLLCSLAETKRTSIYRLKNVTFAFKIWVFSSA